MIKRKFKLRIEEMPVVGGFLYDSFVRDFVDYQGYSPDFNTAYKTSFQQKVSDVEAIVNPKKLIKELKDLTDKLYETVDGLRKPLRLLEGYVNRAGTLTILAGDFGISEVRDKISNKDVEGLLENLKVLFQNIDDNLSALQAKGFTTAAYNDLKGMRDSIKTDNKQQNLLMDDKEELVEDNIDVLNELWEIMSDVMDVGKRIYTDEKPERVGDYTLTTLKKRVRHERKKVSGDDIPPLPE